MVNDCYYIVVLGTIIRLLRVLHFCGFRCHYWPVFSEFIQTLSFPGRSGQESTIGNYYHRFQRDHRFVSGPVQPCRRYRETVTQRWGARKVLNGIWHCTCCKRCLGLRCWFDLLVVVHFPTWNDAFWFRIWGDWNLYFAHLVDVGCQFTSCTRSDERIARSTSSYNSA